MMNKAFLGIALAAHELWLREDERGNRFVATYGSNLSGSNLRGSDLSGSDRVIGPQRSDGYLFTYCMASQAVLAGCRRMTLADYIKHCDTYSDASKKRETLAILECLRLLVDARKEDC
jgi:uncharacterized protein YjbI with pentapeptide repeats